MVDSGASVTIMSSAFFEKSNFSDKILRDPDFSRITGVSGQRLKVLGKKNIPFVINGCKYSYDVHIVEGLHHAFILGIDFLCAHNIRLNFSRNNTLEIPEEPVPNVCLIRTSAGLARAASAVVIPKQSEMIIPVLVSRRKSGDEVLLEPQQNLGKMHLSAAKSLVKVQGGKAVLRLLNPTNTDIKVKKNQVLASVTDIHSAQVYPIDDTNDHSFVGAAEPAQNRSTVETDIKFNLENSDLTSTQKSELLAFLAQHRSNFANDLSELGKTSIHKHRIDIYPGSKPVRLPFYRTSIQNEREMSKQIDEMEKHGIIKPSNSEWHSPVVLVRKKNNTFRFACDYRQLNKITVPMSFPLPHLESVFDSIGAAKANYFSNLDLMSGFWQMELDEESQKKAAFITQRGVYEWTRMPFGLTNAPISFQTLMSSVLRDLNWKSVLVYVDDILIFSHTFEDHLMHLKQVFSKLREANLTLQPSKCHFALKQLKFLGHIISRRGVEVDPDKTQAMSDFPRPKSQKQVRSFLGMANYYRRFIKNFSKIATPLNACLKTVGNKKFQWTEECEQAFQTLKSKLLTAPVLAYPDPSKHFILTCDASDTAVGYVLGQLDDTKKEFVVAYGGKALSTDEKKFSTTEKECLAVLYGIAAYRPYLAHTEFTIVTDHKALVWLQTAKHTGRLERWALKIQEYNFKIVHRPGKSNCVADALSRRDYNTTQVSASGPTVHAVHSSHSDKVSAVAVTSKTQTDCTDKQESIEVTFCYALDEEEDNNQELADRPDLAQLQRECRDFAGIYQYLVDGTLPDDPKARGYIVAESKYYSLVDNVLYHWFQTRGRKVAKELRLIKQLALPKVLRLDALKSYHDSLAGGGHLGVDKVKTAMYQKYYWPGMHNDIVTYVKSCDRCQLAKRDYNPHKPPMVPMPMSKRFERWHIDILGPLNRTEEGYEYVLLCIDSFTRWSEAFPLKSQSAKETADVLYKEIFTRFGAPKILFSDRGRNFMSNLVNALCELFQITQHHTSAYHPNTNGMVERQNSTLAQSLRAYCGKEQSRWPQLLPSVMMAFRKSPSMHSTEFSPFYLMFGEEMRLPFDVSLEPVDNLGRDARAFMQEFMENLKVAHNLAQENQRHHQAKNKSRHDLKATEPNFKLGDLVLFKVNPVPKGYSSKLYDKANGPYRIIELGPNFTYKLKRCSDNKVHSSLINATNLKHYNDPQVQRSNVQSDPVENAKPDQEDNDHMTANDQVDQNEHPQPGTPEVVPPPGNVGEDSEVKFWTFNKLIRGRFRNGHREIYVEWNDKTRSWVRDTDFTPDALNEINRKFTKQGKRRKSYFKNKDFSSQ